MFLSFEGKNNNLCFFWGGEGGRCMYISHFIFFSFTEERKMINPQKRRSRDGGGGGGAC